MKYITALLIFAFLLCGCSPVSAEPNCRVVTEVQIQYHRYGDTLTRTYTRQESISSALMYLRILNPFGPVVPENSDGCRCRILLRFSHGPDRIILLQGDRYMRKDRNPWQKIDSTQAKLLYPLLLLLPSDV